MVDRRRFLTAAAAALVAAGLPAVFAPTADGGRRRRRRRRRRKRRVKTLTTNWWKRRVGSRAVLQGENWHLVKIAEVHPVKSSGVEQFTICFRGSYGDHVSEGIYRVKVRRRKVTLFLQPAGGDESGTYCVANVCRLA